MFENSKKLERVPGQEEMCCVIPLSETEESWREEKERNNSSHFYSNELEKGHHTVNTLLQTIN